MQHRQQTKLYNATIDETRQRRAFRTGDVPVAVYGLGKMGLPLAATYAIRSGNVTGVDLDPDVVSAINDGRCPVDGEPGLPETVATAVANDALAATRDPSDTVDAGLYVIIVPTLVAEGQPDLAALEAAVDDVGGNLTPGDAVFVESTVPPGTCSDVVLPRLEARSGLDRETFGLAFCPERTASGRALRDIQGSYPKVVGGVDEKSTRVGTLVYDEITTNDVIPVTDATTAECVKVFEGVYRDVNIALANELATLADELDIDVRAAIDTANTQPYCDIHEPGAGVGGHCIPYYPHFLIAGCETPVPLVETARAVNERIEEFTAVKVERELARANVPLDDAAVALLGVTYRPGVDETRASPAITIADVLREDGADVFAIDPVCSDMSAVQATPAGLEDLEAIDPDAIVLVTAHDAFEEIPWDELSTSVVVDGRNAVESDPNAPVYTIGSGRTE